MRSINLRSFKCLEPGTRTSRKITKWTLLRYKAILFQVILVLKNWNDKLQNNFKYLIGFTSAGAGCCFFGLGWETQALSTSACGPLHRPQRPKSLLTSIRKRRVQTTLQTARNLASVVVFGLTLQPVRRQLWDFGLLYYPFLIRNTVSYAWPT